MVRKNFKIIVGILAIAIVISGIMAFTAYQWVQADNVAVRDSHELLIPSEATFASVLAKLKDDSVMINPTSFEKVAGWMKFGDEQIKSGRYLILPRWSNRTLINTLRSGTQTPVKVTINNVRTIPEVAGRITQNLELDSLKFLQYVLDPQTLSGLKLTKEEIMSLFIPNTYEVFWNVSPAALVRRMKSENDRFWSAKQRRAKADSLGLTPTEVYTLASIVEKETQAPSERPKVAGLYINRLKNGIPLQADPTVVFAIGDFSLQRVRYKHLAYPSPYNTYLNQGLPPGPIYMSAINSIDAVLDHEKHDYIYMCARPDNSGLHAFAEDQTGHSRNARRYHRWLDQHGIQ